MGSKNYSLLGFILLVILSVFPGCKDDEQLPEVNVQGSEILIANEGNFGWGEGTLSIYNEESKEVQNEVYKAKSGESIGNVFHAIYKINGRYFFVINNSGKIVVTDTNFVKQTEITGLVSPRNIYKVSDNKAYITDLYANAVYVLDLNTLAVTGTIPCRGHSEEGIITEGKFWFTAPKTSNIYAIDISTDQIVDSTRVHTMPETIVLDNDQRIWVMCRGEGIGKLLGLDESGSVDLSLTYEIEGAPTNLVYDVLLDNFYYLNGNIYILDRSVASTPSVWKSAENEVFYSLKVNPRSREVYVSDVKDFVSRSTIYRYSPDGALLDEFSAGIIAGDFFFP